VELLLHPASSAMQWSRKSADFSNEIICTHATKAMLLPMHPDAMSISSRGPNHIRRLEARIDVLSWGFKLRQTLTLTHRTTFKLGNAGHSLGSFFILLSYPDLPARIRSISPPLPLAEPKNCFKSSTASTPSSRS
jgi:Cft2 family RNA processing exonuclease